MMKIFIAIIVTVIVTSYSEVVTETELVYNGGFSEPVLSTPWTTVASVPGGHGTWSTVPPQNGFEIWKQGARGSPVAGADGKPTGQHLEINGNEQWAAIIYELNTPCLLSTTQASYSFEYWYNPGCGCDQFGFTIEQQGQELVSMKYKYESKDWKMAVGNFTIKSCQPLKLSFTSNARGDVGVHIDNVSLKVKEQSAVEMVSGGDFESPKISGAWEKVSSIPSGEGVWSTTSVFVLWRQGAMGSPATDASGKPVGQFLEINSRTTKGQVGYKFFAPYLLGQAKSQVSFKYWIRANGGGSRSKGSGQDCECSHVNYFGYSIMQDGAELKHEKLNTTTSGWVDVSTELNLKPKVAAHIYFTSDTKHIGGIHIDSVSSTIAECRDEDTASEVAVAVPAIVM